MSRLMTIIPAPGKQVRDPVTMRHIPAEGQVVESSPYWLRRIRDGSVSEVVPPAPEPEPITEAPEAFPAKTKKAGKTGGKRG